MQEDRQVTAMIACVLLWCGLFSCTRSITTFCQKEVGLRLEARTCRKGMLSFRSLGMWPSLAESMPRQQQGWVIVVTRCGPL
ncbi:hypothetical protein B0H63DRAFT_289088 [Podospora didyma]|uniref:Uncharacterized protein n=1 Tax=Podospora didyma TaxID=330526 RepID=A0AAE0N660_9PEZI|nr:hypothetical protein B0H63DRAFT_289088 [Podospora didyma]